MFNILKPLFPICCPVFTVSARRYIQSPLLHHGKGRSVPLPKFLIKCLFIFLTLFPPIINTFKALSFLWIFFPYPQFFLYLVPLLILFPYSILLYYLSCCVKGFELLLWNMLKNAENTTVNSYIPFSQIQQLWRFSTFVSSFHLFCFSLWNYFPENPKYHVIFLQHILVPKIKNKLSFLTTMLWLHLIKWTVILHNYFIIIPWLNSPDCLKNICTDYLSKSGLNQGSLITYGRCAF